MRSLSNLIVGRGKVTYSGAGDQGVQFLQWRCLQGVEGPAPLEPAPTVSLQRRDLTTGDSTHCLQRPTHQTARATANTGCLVVTSFRCNNDLQQRLATTTCNNDLQRSTREWAHLCVHAAVHDAALLLPGDVVRAVELGEAPVVRLDDLLPPRKLELGPPQRLGRLQASAGCGKTSDVRLSGTYR